MLALNSLLTLIALALTPLMFLSSRFLAKRAQGWFVSQQRELGAMNGYIEEMISGQKTVSLYSRQKKVVSEFESINERYVKAR